MAKRKSLVMDGDSLVEVVVESDEDYVRRLKDEWEKAMTKVSRAVDQRAQWRPMNQGDFDRIVRAAHEAWRELRDALDAYNPAAQS